MFLIIYLILDREGIAPAIFAFLCLFFADYREHTAHHLHYSLPTYFPVLFTIVLFLMCTEWAHAAREYTVQRPSAIHARFAV